MEYGEQSARRRFNVGALQIDPERCTVSGHGSPSDLTPRAEALLLQLARSPNALVTQEQILQTVWAGRIVEEAVISNCVWQIRKALGPEGKHILQNRAKRGYVLLVPDSAWIVESSPAAELPAAEPTPAQAQVEAQAQAEDPSVADPDEAKAIGISPLAPESESQSEPQSEPQSELQPEPHARPESVPAAVALDGIGADPPIGLQRRTRVTWRRMVVAAVVLLCLGGGGWLWRSKSDASGAQAIAHAGSGTGIPLGPDAEMTVSVQVPGRMDWLRSAALATAVEQAYRRDAHVLLFEKPQKRNPFAGPHLAVQVRSADANAITAELTLTHAQSQLRDSYTGPAQNLSKATEQFLVRHLKPPLRESTPASDILVAGLVADLQHDYQAALTEYRRALARDPALADATLAMASNLIALGRTREAFDALSRLGRRDGLSALQSCRRSTMLANVAPELTTSNECEDASKVKLKDSREAKTLLREIGKDADAKIGARRWLENERAAIQAHIDLHQFEETEDRIAQAEQVAADAGWDTGGAEVAVFRSRLALERGQIADSIELDLRDLQNFTRLNDTHSVIAMRIGLVLGRQQVPGPMIEQQRIELRNVIDLARKIGSPRGEVDALKALVRLDRDRLDLWQSHLDRIEQLTRQWYTPRKQNEEKIYMLTEQLVQRRYGEVIAEVNRMQRSGIAFSQAQLWNLTSLAEAHFYRDEFGAAIAAINAMEKENFDIVFTNPCLFAWLFVEVDQPDRSALMIEKCPFQDYDRAGRARRGDFALLATARAHLRRGESARAWLTLRPRIDELLATPDMTRSEAQSLTLLARHAAAMSGADRARLNRALQVASELAGKDGAGPSLRFGVHTLRWRLCIAAGRADCGPVLPPWAQEDRLEARFAQEYVAALRSPR